MKYVFFIGAEVKYREPLWLTNEKEKGVNSLVKKEVIKIGQTEKGKEKIRKRKPEIYRTINLNYK